MERGPDGDGHGRGGRLGDGAHRLTGGAHRLTDSAHRLTEGAQRLGDTATQRIAGSHLRQPVRRSVGSPLLFSIIWTSLAAAVYFSLGEVSGHALGLTPIVYLLAGLFFIVTAMTYVEGASLHQDRGGSTVFARYAFNELVSFVAGWVILLDYIILIAVAAFSASHYLAAYWRPLGHEVGLVVSLAIILYVALRNVRGFSTTRYRRVMALVGLDLVLQLLVIVIGLVLFFRPHVITSTIHLGQTPSWRNVVFALTITSVAFTSLESASGLSGEVAVGRRGLKRLIGVSGASVLVLFVGMALVAVTAVPIHGGYTPLGDEQRSLQAPVLGVIARFHPAWLHDTLKYVIAGAAAMTLVAVANSAMLGLSRLGYSLSTNRQIPSAVGRLHPRWSTPVVIIVVAAALAAALVSAQDLDFLVGIYAFGAMLAFTIAHVSIIKLRLTEPGRDRPYRMPGTVRIAGRALPLPAVLGAVLSAAGWITVMVVHEGARYVGLAWLLGGLALYVIYRVLEGKPLLRRVTVPADVLRAELPHEEDYSSILVPLLGTDLDDDIMQTAGRLVSSEPTDEAAVDTSTIEAIWVIEVPMALPIDASLPEAQVRRGRAALARAKVVGEEYDGVQVATAIVRARRAGPAIVEQARRRGVEAIVLGAEEPSRVRGGARLGGRGGPLEDFVGETTKYVVDKADARVIVTAPPARDSRERRGAPGTLAPDGAEPLPAGAASSEPAGAG